MPPWTRSTTTACPTTSQRATTTSTRPTATARFFDQYFPPSRYLGNSWYGGYLGQLVSDPVNRLNKNNYELFSAGGLDFIILHLELDVPDYSLNWAERDPAAVLRTAWRSSRPTCSWTRPTPAGRRRSSCTNGNSAEAIWQRLIKPNCNVFMVLNGHYPGEGRRTDLNDCGKPVHQLLADYQDRTNGGDGWLRDHDLQAIREQGLRLHVLADAERRRGLYETDADSQFVLDLDLQGGSSFQPIGTVNGTASGGTASVAWPGLTGGTDYEWYAVAERRHEHRPPARPGRSRRQADTLAPAAPTGLAATPGATASRWPGMPTLRLISPATTLSIDLEPGRDYRHAAQRRDTR